MSAMSFLYLFTGCLDLALKPGQRKQREPQAGRTCREITPDTVLIFIFFQYFPNIKQIGAITLKNFCFKETKLERFSSCEIVLSFPCEKN
jgi:hypothetical protein